MAAHVASRCMLAIVSLDHIPPNRWKHVPGEQNPAGCASRGLLLCELVNHDLWWNGPEWLISSTSNWPQQPQLTRDESDTELVNTCHLASVETNCPLFPLDRFSSYLKIVRVTTWVMRFIVFPVSTLKLLKTSHI